MEAQPTGPYVQAALFCEKVLQEPDHVLSIIRVIDQVTIKVVGAEAPEALPRFGYSMQALIMLKPGSARGRHTYMLSMERPNGLKNEVGTGTANFTGGQNQGASIRLNLNLTFDQEGLYWFDLILDGKLLTRMPFQVLYELIKPGTTQ